MILAAENGRISAQLGTSLPRRKPVELAELAVAYRAVFHAGDNEAFISLDPHKAPTKVTVNLGGFLENTRIGFVVPQRGFRRPTIERYSRDRGMGALDFRVFAGRQRAIFQSLANSTTDQNGQ